MGSPYFPSFLDVILVPCIALAGAFLGASGFLLASKHLLSVMNDQTQHLSNTYRGVQIILGRVGYTRLFYDVSKLVLRALSIILVVALLPVIIVMLIWPYVSYSHGCLHCHRIGCHLACGLLGADRMKTLCSTVYAVHSFRLFSTFYCRPDRLSSTKSRYPRQRAPSSHPPAAELVRISEEGWLVIRLTAYPDIFTCPRPLRRLNHMYLAYWDWKRWSAAVVAYALLKHEGKLNSRASIYALPLGKDRDVTLENNTNSSSGGDRYLFVWERPENYLELCRVFGALLREMPRYNLT